MESVQLSRQDILSIYNAGNDEVKKILEDKCGPDNLKLKIEDRINSLEDACRENGITVEQALPYKIPANSDKYTKGPKQLIEYIETHFLFKLDKAPWRRDDALLVEAAGSCNDCKKRTSCQALLFSDIAKDDRCLDGKCFNEKMAAFIKKKALDVIAHHPDVALVYNNYGGDVDKSILEEAKKMNITVLVSGVAIADSKYWKYTIPQKVFWLNGDGVGKITTGYLSSEKSSNGSTRGVKSSSVKSQIEAITQRRERSEELDFEKIMGKLREQIEAKCPDDKAIVNKITPEIEAITWFMIYDGLSFNADDVMVDLLLDEDSHQEWDEEEGTMLKAMMKLNGKEKANILVHAFLHKYGIGSTARKGKEAFMLRAIAAWLGVDIKAIEAEQKIVADKRKANADKKIAQLKKSQQVVKKPKTKKIKDVKKK